MPQVIAINKLIHVARQMLQGPRRILLCSQRDRKIDRQNPFTLYLEWSCPYLSNCLGGRKWAVDDKTASKHFPCRRKHSVDIAKRLANLWNRTKLSKITIKVPPALVECRKSEPLSISRVPHIRSCVAARGTPNRSNRLPERRLGR
jgi:hypothetical protein